MAGNPLAFLFPHIKKHAILLYILTGVILKYKRDNEINYTYRMVYSEYDFNRRRCLEDFNDDIKNQLTGKLNDKH